MVRITIVGSFLPLKKNKWHPRLPLPQYSSAIVVDIELFPVPAPPRSRNTFGDVILWIQSSISFLIDTRVFSKQWGWSYPDRCTGLSTFFLDIMITISYRLSTITKSLLRRRSPSALRLFVTAFWSPIAESIFSFKFFSVSSQSSISDLSSGLSTRPKDLVQFYSLNK